MLQSRPRHFAVAALALVLLSAGTQAQQVGPPERGGSEIGNFGDTPFANPQIVITRVEDRSKWRQLEDKHLKERRAFEDKYDAELRAMRARQAAERESALKSFSQ